MDSYGRYKNARNAAWQTLIDFDVTAAPVKVVSIATAANIAILKNSDVHELKDGEVGISLNVGGVWYVVYDNTAPRGRVRFTIAHELGHIFLGHPLIDGHHARTIDTARPEAERDADIFAARLLMPSCVIWGLGLHTAEEIKDVFDVSYTAAQIRAERMSVLYERNKFLTNRLEQQVFANFSGYIEAKKRGDK